MKKPLLQIGALVGVIGLILGGFSGAFLFPNKIVETETITITNVVNQTVEVPVDNGNLNLVLNHIYDNEGNVSTLTEYLDDDELESIVDRIVFLNEIKSLAVAEVKAEAADELDKEVFNETNITFDEDEIERIRVQDDDNEVIVSDVDFDDKDADVKVTVYFEQDDDKYEADFNVEIKDGEVDDLTFLDARLR